MTNISKKQPKKSPLFNTNDIGLTAALIIKGKGLLLRERLKKKRLSFTFVDSHELQIMAAAYFHNNLLVPAQPYYQEIRKLETGRWLMYPKK